METWDAPRSRRNVRSYTDEPIEPRQLTYAITLVAADLGIGTGHAPAQDQVTARRVLGGVPDTHQVAWLIALGHPADRPLAPTGKLVRRAFDDVVHRGAW